MSEVGLTKSELDTPVLWIDLDRMERNIAALAAEFRRAAVQWRPHIKGIKVPAIAHKLIQAGAIGVTCAKLAEAEVMVAAGIHDILIANQVVGDIKLRRLVNLLRHADVKVAVDDQENVEALGRTAEAAGTQARVVIEVDTGMHRAGVLPGEPVLALAQHIERTPGVRFMGLMAWEGHNLALTDPIQKRMGIEQSIREVAESAELCQSHGLDVHIVSGGGSGTYSITAYLPGITEIQAGGAIFCDQTYQGWGVELEPALFIRATVTSRPAPDRIIYDAGFKTSPRGFATPKPLAFDVDTIVLSAEHGIARLPVARNDIKVGDAFDLLVGYGDATVFLHDRIYGVRGERVETVWDVQARGKLR